MKWNECFNWETMGNGFGLLFLLQGIITHMSCFHERSMKLAVWCGLSFIPRCHTRPEEVATRTSCKHHMAGHKRFAKPKLIVHGLEMLAMDRKQDLQSHEQRIPLRSYCY